MKQLEDDDLIITNLDGNGNDNGNVDGNTSTGSVQADNGNTSTDSVQAEGGQSGDKEQEHNDNHPSLREALSSIHEDESEKPQRMTLNKILVGDFFTSQILRRQLGIIIVCAIIILIYISNRYTCQKQMIEIDKLKKELQDAKYKALSTSSQLTEKSRQSNVLYMLKLCNDSSLHAADQAPYIIQVPE